MQCTCVLKATHGRIIHNCNRLDLFSVGNMVRRKKKDSTFHDYCWGVTIRSAQQHNQDLREIYKVGRIHHFLPECIAFNQESALHFFLPECIAPRTTQIKTRGSSVGERVHRSLFRLRVFFVANFLQHG